MENQPIPRSCSNCACFARMTPDGSLAEPSTTLEGAQPVCRRSPPNGRYQLMDIPVFDPKTGAPVLDKQDRQRVERRNVLQIGYPPVVPSAVCWDGWRPTGTEPGDHIGRLWNGSGAHV